MINGLDLFSGIGGLALALRQWVRPISYCENDRYAQSVILSRMWAGQLPVAPIWDDVCTLRREHLRYGVDIIYGGFPCQDISAAGLGKGLDAERSGLYWQIHRLAKEIKPEFIFLENVPAIRTRGLNLVAQSLTELGYDLRWTTLSAAEVGAPHLRKRWFMLAHANGLRKLQSSGSFAELGRRAGNGSQEFVANAEGIGRLERRAKPNSKGQTEPSKPSGELAEPASKGLERWLDAKAAWSALRLGGGGGGDSWPQGLPQPSICRDADGFSSRVDRLRGLGNAVVPLQAKTAFERLMGLSA